MDASAATKWLQSLPFWRGDGRNHVIVYLTRQTTTQNPLLAVNTGRAIVAQSTFTKSQFRYGFDVIISTLSAIGLGRSRAVFRLVDLYFEPRF